MATKKLAKHKHSCTAEGVVNKVLDRAIVWVEWEDMPPEERKKWGADARSVLMNPVFMSLAGRSSVLHGKATSGQIAKNCIEEIARRSKSHEETVGIRHVICGVELIREILEECLYQESRVTNEEPNAAL